MTLPRKPLLSQQTSLRHLDQFDWHLDGIFWPTVTKEEEKKERKENENTEQKKRERNQSLYKNPSIK